MAIISKKYISSKRKFSYSKFDKLNGDHPFKNQTSFSYVEYNARIRPGGKIRYFNYKLAKEMNLIASYHPEKMNKDLEKTLLDTFAVMIINEFDLINNKEQVDPREFLDRRYMATRYLQLQNPNKKGVFSGDGRSIWNGVINSKNGLWDVTSCGTGATCLSPATKIHKRFFENGDPYISYGCGFSTYHEGLVDVIFSEMFNQKGLQTERVLCVITFEDGYSIKVRAGKNLIRPSHIFAPLKQNKLERLKEVVDYTISRDQINGNILASKKENKYKLFLESFAKSFADIAARFEQEYIFCWLDWDGDNIMVNGGLLDFGSIRQFGVYHHEYKFDDDGNWSTNIKEQVTKARYTVKVMHQAVDYIMRGKKTPLQKYFSRKKYLNIFDKTYVERKYYYFLQRLGFSKDFSRLISKRPTKDFLTLFRAFSNLEKRKAAKGFERTPDGKNITVMFNMRKFTREIFGENLEKTATKIVLQRSLTSEAEKLGASHSASDYKNALLVTDLLNKIIKKHSFRFQPILMRALKHNQPNRITGDAVCVIAEYLAKKSKKIREDELYKVFELYLKRQESGKHLVFDFFDLTKMENKKIHSICRHIENILEKYSESI